MRIPVFVLTSTPGFGILIQQTLEDSGRYQVSLAEDASQALHLAGNTSFGLSILDASEEEVAAGGQGIALGDLIQSLREKLPGMRLMLVPPGNDPEHPLIHKLRPDGTLTKPFYLPDLLEMIDKVMQTTENSPVPAASHPEPGGPGVEPSEAPAWLADVDRTAQYLARLSLESAAQAALIVQAGKLWAYAGELIQPAAQELAETVAHHWSRGGSSDLARFIRLEATQSEFMLYATGLGRNMVLALVFDVETPFSKIRSQASSLARSLASPPGSENQPPPPETRQSDPASAEDEPIWPPADLPPLFDDVPPPQATGWEDRSHSRHKLFSAGGVLDERSPNREEERAGEAASPLDKPLWEPGRGMGLAGFDLPEPPPSDPLAETRPILVGQTSAESLSDGPEVVPDEPGAFDSLESASVAVCNLNYACMLIPRLPQHHLTGDLGVRLSDWVVQLCLAFGWRLGHLAVRPDYLLWIVNVSPTVSPSYLVRLMRQHTSQRIFTQFAEIAQENPSGDFWAPGYLVMSSTHAPPVEVMHNFIQGTRRRQGVVNSAYHSRTIQE